jgi:hypothetical protein
MSHISKQSQIEHNPSKKKKHTIEIVPKQTIAPTKPTIDKHSDSDSDDDDSTTWFAEQDKEFDNEDDNEDDQQEPRKSNAIADVQPKSFEDAFQKILNEDSHKVSVCTTYHHSLY